MIKYIIDAFCNRRNVVYGLVFHKKFDWSKQKQGYVYLVLCKSCWKSSLHLSYEKLVDNDSSISFNTDEIDSHIFYSVPTSFFVIDERIPRIIRELIAEAEGCVKMNFLNSAHLPAHERQFMN